MHTLATSATPIYDSSEVGSPALRELRELWRYRSLLYQLIRRDLVTRYKRSILGIAWTMLNPLGMMVVLTLVFSQLFKSVQGYSAYVLTGLVTWNFFAQTTSTALNTLLWGGTLLRRIYMPPTCFALSAIGTGVVNFVLTLVPLAAVVLATGSAIGPTWLFLPVSVLLLAAFSLGVALILSAVGIYFYDVAEMYSIILAAWMYLTPLFYPPEVLPAAYRGWLLGLNPMYHLVRLIRLPIHDSVWPAWSDVWPAALVSASSLAVGWLVFTAKSREFAYRV